MKKKVLVCIEQSSVSYKYFIDLISGLSTYSGFEIEIFNLVCNKEVNDYLATTGNKVVTLPSAKPYKKQVFRIAAIIRKSNPDIIHAHESIPAFYAALALRINFSDIKLIFHRHHSFYRDKTIHFMERVAFRRCNLAIAVSATAQQQAIAEHPAYAKKIVYIYNGVTLKDTGMPLPIDMAPYAGRPKIILIAWLVGRKGHETAIAAMQELVKKMPAAVLFFAGDGPDRKKLELLVAENKLQQHIVLLGEVKNIYALLQQTDISILPSEAEAFNLSILETMAAKKLSMASDIPSINECIADGETGVSIPVNDAHTLAAKLEYYLSNNNERERIAANGYDAYRQRFTTEAMVKQVAAVYEKM